MAISSCCPQSRWSAMTTCFSTISLSKMSSGNWESKSCLPVTMPAISCAKSEEELLHPLDSHSLHRDIGRRPIAGLGRGLPDFPDHIHTFHDLSKHRMAVVQMRRRRQ